MDGNSTKSLKDLDHVKNLMSKWPSLISEGHLKIHGAISNLAQKASMIWDWFDSLKVDEKIDVFCITDKTKLTLIFEVLSSSRLLETSQNFTFAAVGGMFLALENNRSGKFSVVFCSWKDLELRSSRFSKPGEEYELHEKELMSAIRVYDYIGKEGKGTALSFNNDCVPRAREIISNAIKPSSGHGAIATTNVSFTNSTKDKNTLYSGSAASLIAVYLFEALKSSFSKRKNRITQSIRLCYRNCEGLRERWNSMTRSERSNMVGMDEPEALYKVDGETAIMLMFSRSIEDHNTAADERIRTYGEAFQQYHAEYAASSLANSLLEEENKLKDHNSSRERSTASKKKRNKRKKRRNVNDANSILEYNDVHADVHVDADVNIDLNIENCAHLVGCDIHVDSKHDNCDSSLKSDDETNNSSFVIDTRNTSLIDSDGEDAYEDALSGIEFSDNEKEAMEDKGLVKTTVLEIVEGEDKGGEDKLIETSSNHDEHNATSNWEPVVYSSSRHRSARRQSRSCRQSRSSTFQSEISCDSSDTMFSSSDFDCDSEAVTGAIAAKDSKNLAENCKAKSVGRIKKELPEHPEDNPRPKSMRIPFAVVREVEPRCQTSMLHDDLKEMADMLEMVAQRRRPWQLAVAERIKAAVELLFPGGTALVFGSLASGLAAPCSDVDMVVCSYGNYTPQQAMHILAEHLGRQEWVQMLEAIHHTPVPVIRLGTACIPVSFGSQVSGSLIAVDITFETVSHHGLRTCEIVKGFAKEYPPLKPLTLVLKQFLVEKGLNDPFVGGLSSYGLILMLVNMFKLRYPQGLSSDPGANLGSLFIEFLDLYKVPTFSGQRVSMLHLAPGVPLYIQDPIDPMNNIGRSCFGIYQVIQAFAEAHDAIQVSAIPSKEADWSVLGAVFSTGHHKHVVNLVKQVWCPKENQISPKAELEAWALSARSLLLELMQERATCISCHQDTSHHSINCKLGRIVRAFPSIMN